MCGFDCLESETIWISNGSLSRLLDLVELSLLFGESGAFECAYLLLEQSELFLLLCERLGGCFEL